MVDFPLCGLKKCECEFLRAVVFMFEKLQLEIKISMVEDNVTFISCAIGL